MNDRFYYGVRRCKSNCDIFEDKYFGSGVLLKAAIKKYGKENFTKELVFIFGDRREAYDWEKELITKEFLHANPSCYNIRPGGEGGSISGRKCSSETRRLQSIAHLGMRNPLGCKRSAATKLKMSIARRNYHANRRIEDVSAI